MRRLAPVADFDYGHGFHQDLDLGLLGHFEGIVDLDTQVPHRALDFAVAQEQLDSPQVFGSLVNQGCLGPAHGMGTVARRIQPQVPNPALQYPGVLARAYVASRALSAGEQVVIPLQTRSADPGLSGFPGRGRNFELDWTLRFALKHDCPAGNLVPVADIPDP